MKKFLKYISFFLIPILILGVIMEIALRKIPNDYAFKKNQLTLQKEEIKTLIIGSSHSMYGLNPEFFTENAFNLSHVSQTIDLDYYLLKKYIEVLPKLETVIVRLSYTTLHEQLSKGPESWRLKDYNLYYNLNVSNQLKFESEVLSVKLKNNFSRLKDYYFDYNKMITVKSSGWAYFGQEQAEGSLEYYGPIVAKRHTAKEDVFVKENKEFVERIIQLCRDRGVKVLFVTFPAHKNYRDSLDSLQLELVVNEGKEMTKTYQNCSYLNVLNNNNFNNKDFYDPDHLNENGAKKLSILVDTFLTTR